MTTTPEPTRNRTKVGLGLGAAAILLLGAIGGCSILNSGDDAKKDSAFGTISPSPSDSPSTGKSDQKPQAGQPSADASTLPPLVAGGDPVSPDDQLGAPSNTNAIERVVVNPDGTTTVVSIQRDQSVLALSGDGGGQIDPSSVTVPSDRPVREAPALAIGGDINSAAGNSDRAATTAPSAGDTRETVGTDQPATPGTTPGGSGTDEQPSQPTNPGNGGGTSTPDEPTNAGNNGGTTTPGGGTSDPGTGNGGGNTGGGTTDPSNPGTDNPGTGNPGNPGNGGDNGGGTTNPGDQPGPEVPSVYFPFDLSGITSVTTNDSMRLNYLLPSTPLEPGSYTVKVQVTTADGLPYAYETAFSVDKFGKAAGDAIKGQDFKLDLKPTDFRYVPPVPEDPTAPVDPTTPVPPATLEKFPSTVLPDPTTGKPATAEVSGTVDKDGDPETPPTEVPGTQVVKIDVATPGTENPGDPTVPTDPAPTDPTVPTDPAPEQPAPPVEEAPAADAPAPAAAQMRVALVSDSNATDEIADEPQDAEEQDAESSESSEEGQSTGRRAAVDENGDRAYAETESQSEGRRAARTTADDETSTNERQDASDDEASSSDQSSEKDDVSSEDTTSSSRSEESPKAESSNDEADDNTRQTDSSDEAPAQSSSSDSDDASTTGE